MADDSMALGYALGQDSNNNGNCNSGFFGGDGWWAIILFAMIFSWGNGGYGGFGGGINSAAGQGALTRADLCSELTSTTCTTQCAAYSMVSVTALMH